MLYYERSSSTSATNDMAMAVMGLEKPPNEGMKLPALVNGMDADTAFQLISGVRPT